MIVCEDLCVYVRLCASVFVHVCTCVYVWCVRVQ